MAGFVGICSNNLSSAPHAIQGAVSATVYADNTGVKHIHADSNLMVEKSFVKFTEPDKMVAFREDVHVWVDGEIYNQGELKNKAGDFFVDTVLQHYLNDTLETLLRKVDGIFVVLIYDLRKQQLRVITDRYGIKLFYLYAKNNCFILAPELKCFPFFEQFKLEIRKEVIDCFIQLEHLMDTVTWFEGVSATMPSTIYTYSWQTNQLTDKKYWSWSLNKRASLDLNQAAEEMISLLDNAVKVRAVGDCKIGVGLSGGYDSRSMLAAIQESKPIT